MVWRAKTELLCALNATTYPHVGLLAFGSDNAAVTFATGSVQIYIYTRIKRYVPSWNCRLVCKLYEYTFFRTIA